MSGSNPRNDDLASRVVSEARAYKNRLGHYLLTDGAARNERPQAVSRAVSTAIERGDLLAGSTTRCVIPSIGNAYPVDDANTGEDDSE